MGEQEDKVVTRNLRENIVEYLEEIESLSGQKISDEQKKELIKYVGSTTFKVIIPEDARKRFNEIREKLKDKWVRHTFGGGKRWPRIKNDFTAHHIIKINVSGPNEWWNIFPLEYLGHDFLHKMDSNVCHRIFEESGRVYCFKDSKRRIKAIVENLSKEELLEKIDKDYKIMKDLKCEDVIVKYTNEIGYYLELIVERGYIDLATKVLEEYGDTYKLVTANLVDSSLKVDNEEFSISLINKKEDIMDEHGAELLSKACINKRRKVVEHILGMDKCPKIDSVYRENRITISDVSDITKRTIFDYACTSGDIEIIRSFVNKKGANFDHIDVSRRNQVMYDIGSRGIRNYLRKIKEGKDNKSNEVRLDVERTVGQLNKYRDWFKLKK